MKPLSQRANTIKPSATLQMDAKAKRMKAEGVDVLSFSAGEPDMDTPSHIKEAAKKAIDAGFTKYCPATGTPSLKEAVVARLQSDHGLQYAPSQVAVSCGAKHAIFEVLMALLDDGDEVLTHSPCWVSYPDMALLCGGVPKLAPTDPERGFHVILSEVEKAITPKTKVFILNSPCNPTGAVFSRNELEDLAHLMIRKDLWVIADEIYDKLLYDGRTFVSFSSLGEEVKRRTVLINGVSKSYSMTGWRIGYAVGPQEVIDTVGAIQSQMTSNPTSISLKASEEALRGPQDAVEAMRKVFEHRRDLIHERLNALPKVRCVKPEGAFYAFADFRAYMGQTIRGTRVENDLQFAEWLLTEARVAAVPGSPFGQPGFLRFSFATSEKAIEEGVDRIRQLLTRDA